MECEELRHDRHTVSLLTDRMVFSPKYSGKILVGDVALALDGITRKAYKDLNIEISDMAVNVDHVHRFVKYPPKYSVIYMAKRIKGMGSRELRRHFYTSRNGVVRVCGHPLTYTARLVTGGMLWGDAYRVGRNRMRKRKHD